MAQSHILLPAFQFTNRFHLAYANHVHECPATGWHLVTVRPSMTLFVHTQTGEGVAVFLPCLLGINTRDV